MNFNGAGGHRNPFLLTLGTRSVVQRGDTYGRVHLNELNTPSGVSLPCDLGGAELDTLKWFRNRFLTFFLIWQLLPAWFPTPIQNPLSVLKSEHGKCPKKHFLSTGSAVWPPSEALKKILYFSPKNTQKTEQDCGVCESLCEMVFE